MIFKRELSINKRALFIWIIVLGGLNFLMLSLFPEIAKQKENLDVLLKSLPESMLKAFDMDIIDFGDILGFYAVKGYIMIALFGSVYAALLSSNIISKEENEKTIEFLLSKPITRTRLITEKLLAVLTNIILLNVGVSLLTFIGFKMAPNTTFDVDTFILLSIAPLFLHLTFASISYFASTVVKKGQTVSTISLAIIFIMYFLDILAKTSDKLANLKYITPFEYVNAAKIVNTNSLEPLYISIMFFIIVFLTLLTYIVYQRKDITV